MPEEAQLEETEFGRKPTTAGWFVVNVRDTGWVDHEQFGSGCTFEGKGELCFQQVGINISVVKPGQPLCLYHEESGQEDFLVLSGACTLIVDDEERPMRAWDFFHCPPGTPHLLVGAGDGPAIVLAVGARIEPETLRYPISEVAGKYGGSSLTDTPDAGVAYGDGRFERPAPGRPSYWNELPWA